MGNGGPSARADDPIYGLIQGSPMCGDIARLAVAQVFVEHHLHILAMPLVDQEAGKVGTADQGRVGRIRRGALETVRYAQRRQPVGDFARPHSTALTKIGRASGRERVWKNG